MTNAFKEYEGGHDHLNKTDPLIIFGKHISFDKLAKMVAAKNYGTLRFLAALIRARGKFQKSNGGLSWQLTEQLRKLLDSF